MTGCSNKACFYFISLTTVREEEITSRLLTCADQ